MDELIRYIAAGLVEKPDKVSVNMKDEGDVTVIELSVAPDDMGKVIGKQGRIAKAIRAIVKAAGTQEEKKYVLEIV
ncbi:MAG: KH domain-containing protein [Clostridiales bacterium]|jgi:predicted RNA-binding protein YlqC (UPF0109 family)|nr:KH domain-containing protein [Clostridiales bacterium]